MGDPIGLFLFALVVVGFFAMWGHQIAKDQGRNPMVGLLAGLIPLVGVGLLLYLGRKTR